MEEIMKIDDVFTGLYKTFKDNDDRIVVIVCGRPGTGKSTITRYLAERFRKTGVFLRVFAKIDNDIWPAEDRFAVENRNGSISLTGQILSKKEMPILNIFDERETFDDFREEFTDPITESAFMITRDVTGLLSYLKSDREANERQIILMPIKEYVVFKPLITKHMFVIAVNQFEANRDRNGL